MGKIYNVVKNVISDNCNRCQKRKIAQVIKKTKSVQEGINKMMSTIEITKMQCRR